MKWDEQLQIQRGGKEAGIKREMEWQEVCREIAMMNRPYART
jgi:dual specificity MAP kinase phosphatase